ncbi:MAG: glycoside hydrolase [Planctomycetota bacterium]|jgi:O-glycosyl hydrolase
MRFSSAVVVYILIVVPPFWLVVYGAGGAGDQLAHIKIDFSQRYQRIDGFGSSMFGGFTLFERGHCDAEFAKGLTYKTTPQQRKDMVTTAVVELGVTHLRMWLPPSGIELTNDNDDSAVMDWDAFTWEGCSKKPLFEKQNWNRRNGLKEWGDVLTVAVPLGLKNWIVTPGGMPKWLHKKINDRDDQDRFEEYAEWAAAHLLYLKRTFGLEAPYWSMFNEPDVKGWKSPEMWREWIKTTGRRFRREGLRTKIMVPDYMNVYAAIPLTEAILKDAEARPYIGAIAYHHYRSSFDDPKPFLRITTQPETADSGRLHKRLTAGARGMAELGRKYDLPSWQTETAYYPKPLRRKKLSDWDVGLGRANEIYYELVSGASAVQGMLMIWIDAIDPRVNFTTRTAGHHIVMDTDGEKVTQWKVTKDCGAIFAHYGRFVKPGDYRIAATCEDKLVRVTAFSAQQGACCVSVAINNANIPQQVKFDVKDLPFKPVFVGGLLTDQKHAMVSHPIDAIDGSENNYQAELPPISVCTFLWSPKDEVKLTLPGHVKFR